MYRRHLPIPIIAVVSIVKEVSEVLFTVSKECKLLLIELVKKLYHTKLVKYLKIGYICMVTSQFTKLFYYER